MPDSSSVVRAAGKLPLIVGNWKMNKTPTEARLLARVIVGEVGELDTAEVVLCPPFTALPAVGDEIRYSNIVLGAQNMSDEKSGACTGEVSGVFLKDLGCAYVILGHSERRRHFGETDVQVARKVKTALELGITPIVCIGETAEEKDSGKTRERLRAQFAGSIAAAVSPAHVIVVAYEPVWAIGTGRSAAPVEAEEEHEYIRWLAAEYVDRGWAATLRLIYGGSVTPDSIDDLMAQPQVDGVLVGGASLQASFTRIVRFQTKS